MSIKDNTDMNIEIENEQAQVLKELEKIIGKQIPHVDNIDSDTFGVQVVDENIVGLGFYYCGLKYLPESIGKLTSLQVLELMNNNLTELPKSIGNLNSLKILDLDSNHITHLPQSIGNLIALEGLLSLANNQLTSLPESIGNLIFLKELDLNKNIINTLPESFRDMKSLKILDLRYNPISRSRNQDERTKSLLKDLKKHGVKIYKS